MPRQTPSLPPCLAMPEAMKAAASSVAHADIADTILAFAQRLDDRIDAVADNAEHERCAPGNQRLDQNIEGVNLRPRWQNWLRRHLGVGSEGGRAGGADHSSRLHEIPVPAPFAAFDIATTPIGSARQPPTTRPVRPGPTWDSWLGLNEQPPVLHAAPELKDHANTTAKKRALRGSAKRSSAEPAVPMNVGNQERNAGKCGRAATANSQAKEPNAMGLFSKDIKNMNDLFVHTLRDIYYAEKQIVKALPDMIEKANDPQLKEGFQGHLRQTENHVKRLEQVFQLIGKQAQGVDARRSTASLKKPTTSPAKSSKSRCSTPPSSRRHRPLSTTR